MTEKIDKWLVLVIGLVGGWVISTAPGWMRASSYEHWWNIATAIGTVSVVIVALWQANRHDRTKVRADRQRIEGLLSIVNEAVYSLIWVADELRIKTMPDETIEITVTELKAFVHAAESALRIPYYEDPFCGTHGALIFCLSDLRSAILLVEQAFDRADTDIAAKIDEVAESARSNFEFAFTMHSLREFKMPDKPWFILRDFQVEIKALHDAY